MSEKTKGLLANMILYAVAFAVGLIPFSSTGNLFMAEALFTITATAVIFLATCFYPDTSLYDPYWSVAPPFMLLIGMVKYHYWNVNAVLMLFVTLVWAVRLTGNWYLTYPGLGHEDWRYAMYRKKLGKTGFFLVNLIGLQYVPTLVVYAGLVNGLFVIQQTSFTLWILPGLLVMLAGVTLEYVSDTAIHQFLREHRGEHLSCRESVWKYSRHPNYLGEMTFWTGMFLAFLGVCPSIWYYGLGFLLIIALFLFVSIPMMEKHNLENREDYAEYQSRTSVLLLWRERV